MNNINTNQAETINNPSQNINLDPIEPEIIAPKNAKGKNIFTVKQLTLILTYLIQGLGTNHILAQAKQLEMPLHHKTLKEVENSNRQFIEYHKNELQKKLIYNQESKYKDTIKKFLITSNRALDKITDKKLDESSASALATVAGISIDKFSVATGGASEVVHVKFPDRQAMIDYIKGNAIKPPTTVKPAIPDVIDADTVESKSKHNANVNANLTKVNEVCKRKLGKPSTVKKRK